MKCNLCKFDDLFDNKSHERFLLTHRNDMDKLQTYVDIYWQFVQKISKEDKNALNFLNQDYVWSFRDYRNQISMRSTIEEIIEHNEELISANGLEIFFKNFV